MSPALAVSQDVDTPSREVWTPIVRRGSSPYVMQASTGDASTADCKSGGTPMSGSQDTPMSQDVEAPRPTTEQRASVRVLTVDDQALFRRQISAVIDKTPGFEQAAEAASGEEAIALVVSQKPDLALVDVRMPGLSGFDTARRITEARTGTAVVLISAMPCPKAAIEAAGAVAFVLKEQLSPSVLEALWATYGPASQC